MSFTATQWLPFDQLWSSLCHHKVLIRAHQKQISQLPHPHKLWDCHRGLQHWVDCRVADTEILSHVERRTIPQRLQWETQGVSKWCKARVLNNILYTTQKCYTTLLRWECCTHVFPCWGLLTKYNWFSTHLKLNCVFILFVAAHWSWCRYQLCKSSV